MREGLLQLVRIRRYLFSQNTAFTQEQLLLLNLQSSMLEPVIFPKPKARKKCECCGK